MTEIKTLYASHMDRHMECNGSILLDEQAPTVDSKDESDSSKEGTAAHWVVEKLLKGEKVKPKAKASNGWVVDEDMIYHATEYIGRLPNVTAESSEASCSWDVDGTRFRIGVRSDYYYFDPETNTLLLSDYKYGYRTVDPENNWQLICGVIGICRKLGINPTTFVLSIYQPRAFHPDGPLREWTIDLPTLSTKFAEIYNMLSSAPNNKLQTSKHCRYCRSAASICPAVRTAMFNAVDIAMTSTAVELSTAYHSSELELMKRANEIIKQRTEWLTDLAVKRIDTDKEIIPGFATKPKLGKTQWKNEAGLPKLGKELGIKMKEYKAITPAAAKRQLKLLGVDETKIDAHTTRPERGRELTTSKSLEKANKVLNNE